MAKHKLTSSAAVRKHIHVSTAYYPALEASRFGAYREVPYIRLRGHWLANAGFSPNDRLNVRIEAGRIVLTRL